jgi:hypothetical protein
MVVTQIVMDQVKSYGLRGVCMHSHVHMGLSRAYFVAQKSERLTAVEKPA